jgi:type II secretory pathway pseudopilin PulG
MIRINLSPLAIRQSRQRKNAVGFTMVELLISSTLMAVSLLSIGGLMVLVYANVAKSGRTTEGLAAARELFEDLQTIPFDDLGNLDGFDTDDPSSLPLDGPELEIARKWRHSLAQEGVGWSFTDEEKLRWGSTGNEGQTTGHALVSPGGGRGRIDVTPQGTALQRITIEVEIPGLIGSIELSTLMGRVN